MLARTLGKTGISVSPIGFGAVKIGRNQQTKYGDFLIPNDHEVEQLLLGILDLGINLIDTAPAYGLSESRIGKVLKKERDRCVLSTKVGEAFVDGKSEYDFSSAAIEKSVSRSLRRLQTDYVDLLLLHSNGQDQKILKHTDAVETLERIRHKGWTRAIGFSGYQQTAETECLNWADVMMIEYHPENTARELLINQAQGLGVGVLVKKGLDCGRIAPDVAIDHALSQRGVSSLVIGSLNLNHWAQNAALAITANAKESN
ncbi:MAG: aldo/keto reductase [Planctomycetota bacterium]|nr:aldo/keto reductase [Planctomycetota bacterium]